MIMRYSKIILDIMVRYNIEQAGLEVPHWRYKLISVLVQFLIFQFQNLFGSKCIQKSLVQKYLGPKELVVTNLCKIRTFFSVINITYISTQCCTLRRPFFLNLGSKIHFTIHHNQNPSISGQKIYNPSF